MLRESTQSVRALVVVPAFNEAANVAEVVNSVLALELPVRHDVLIVDDGSSDKTASLARESGARVLSLILNLGYGNALRAGYMYATTRGYDLVVQMDADGQHDAHSIPSLIAPLLQGTADVVIGSRFGTTIPYRMSFHRRLGQVLFSRLLRHLSGVHVRDVTSGFQALGPRTLALYTLRAFPNYYPDANVLLWSALRGLRIIEVAAQFHEKRGSQSMHRGVLRPTFYVYSMLFSMILVYLANRRISKEVT
jgi:glycosyltransferase involved in cell wall biosynthesis